MDPVSRAQAGDYESLQNRTKTHRWKKGQSGNPGGRPKKLHITKMFEQVLAKAKNRNDIKKALLETLTSTGMAKVLMLREMAERTEGKVTQEVDMNVTGTVVLAEIISERRRKRDNSDSRQS
jgi:hypothetical protein